jgi:site-specific recombinase XerD
MSQLLQKFDEKLIQKGYARSTRKTYGGWVEKYFRYILKLHGKTVRPEKMTAKDVEHWLTHLAVKEYLAPTSQNVALQSVLFLYRELLGIELQGIDALRSKKPQLMPVVLNMAELGLMFGELKGIPLLIAKLQTGCGLRIGEACSLRIKDLDFDRQQMTVRHAKGAKDRVTVFPVELHDAVRSQIRSMEVLFEERPKRTNMPGVSMPYAFDRKSTSACTSWPWFYLFASGQLSEASRHRKAWSASLGPRSHQQEVYGSGSQGAIDQAVHITRVSTFAFATYMLSSNGTDIKTLASMLGHSDVRTTMVYLHCNINSGQVQKTPFGDLLSGEASRKPKAKPPLQELLSNPVQRTEQPKLRIYAG